MYLVCLWRSIKCLSMILIAYCFLVCLCRPSTTWEKLPSPSLCTSSKSAKVMATLLISKSNMLNDLFNDRSVVAGTCLGALYFPEPSRSSKRLDAACCVPAILPRWAEDHLLQLGQTSVSRRGFLRHVNINNNVWRLKSRYLLLTIERLTASQAETTAKLSVSIRLALMMPLDQYDTDAIETSCHRHRRLAIVRASSPIQPLPLICAVWFGSAHPGWQC